MNTLVANIFDDLKSLIRFRFAAMMTAWAVCLLGWFVVLAWPDKYSASARVFVDTRTALTPILQGLAIQQDVSSQLNFVQQSLLGVTQLEKVARITDSAFDSRSKEEKQRLLQRLRSSVSVSVEGYSGGGAVYTIRYQDGNRERSLQAVNVLLNDFVQDTLGGKRESSETAQKFLVDQIQEYENRLRDAEQKLADFKKANVGAMPGEQGDYFARLQAQLDAKQRAEASLTVVQTKRVELQRQLKGEVVTSVMSDVPKTSDSSLVMSDTSSRIKDTEAKRDQLLLKYTEKHPEVVALNGMLEELYARRAAEISALKRGDSGAAVASGAITNPVYQSIQLALNQTDVQLAELRGQIADYDRQIAGLRRVVDTVPQVEAEFARLNRDYNVTRAQYTALVERLEKAKLGDQAEQSGSIRFEVVDPPTASIKPISPQRGILMPLILVLGVGAGAAVAYLLHLMKPVFSNARRVTDITGLPVLGVVSVTDMDQQRQAILKNYFSYAVLMFLLLVTFATVMVANESASQVLRRALG